MLKMSVDEQTRTPTLIMPYAYPNLSKQAQSPSATTRPHHLQEQQSLQDNHHHIKCSSGKPAAQGHKEATFYH